MRASLLPRSAFLVFQSHEADSRSWKTSTI